MTPDPSYLLTKIRRLSQTLFISGALNIGVLALFSYWLIRERPPLTYLESKPASYEQQQLPLADSHSCGEIITRLRPLSFDQLVAKLESIQLIENGYTERDLALTSLVAFHHFDLARALPKGESLQQRLLMWKNSWTGESIPLSVYPGLTQTQFEAILSFAKTEQWPLTSEGVFLLLQKQKDQLNLDPSLVEAFMMTPEFLIMEVLFKRIDIPIKTQRLLEVILEGDWPAFKQFVSQQKQLNDVSIARRQKFLLDYINKRSEAAAYLFLELDPEFAIKKLDDAQVITLLQLLPTKTLESERFAHAMLISPRSTSVWQQASLRLYEYAGEPIPEDWDYQTSLQRFAPDQLAGKQPAKPASEVAPVIKPVVTLAQKSTEIPKNQVASSSVKPSPKGTVAASQATANPTSKKDVNLKRNSSVSYRLYIVQEGDSLWKISRRFGVDMEVLKKRNQLQSNAIKPGTVLKIP